MNDELLSIIADALCPAPDDDAIAHGSVCYPRARKVVHALDAAGYRIEREDYKRRWEDSEARAQKYLRIAGNWREVVRGQGDQLAAIEDALEHFPKIESLNEADRQVLQHFRHTLLNILLHEGEAE